MHEQHQHVKDLLTTVAQKVAESAYDQAEILRGACVDGAGRLSDAFIATLNTHSITSGQVRVVMDGVRVPPYHYDKNISLKVSHFDLVDRGRLNRLFERGATILMDDAQTAIPQVLDLCESMSESSGMQVAGTIFCSPPHSEGFALHQDAEDVVVVQLHGEKEWLVYPPIELAASSMLRGAEVGEPAFRTRLQPGDVMVMPKGSPHKTISNSSTGSIHLTLGMYHVTYRDLLGQVLKLAGADWLDSPTTGASSADLRTGLVGTDWEWLTEGQVQEAHGVARRSLIADLDRFEPLASDDGTSGGRYRLLGSAGRAMQLLLTAQLERSDEEIGAVVDALGSLKKGDSFDYVQLFGRLEDPVVAEEILHALLRLRLIVREG